MSSDYPTHLGVMALIRRMALDGKLPSTVRSECAVTVGALMYQALLGIARISGGAGLLPV